MAESARLLCAQSQRQLQFENHTTAQQLSLDKSFVSQVADNLIANAVRYASQTVTLCAEKTDNSLVLTISDDDPGFHEGLLTKATQPYFTSEENRSSHFGLGLYICKLLCKHHGGALVLKNLPNSASITASFQFQTQIRTLNP